MGQEPKRTRIGSACLWLAPLAVLAIIFALSAQPNSSAFTEKFFGEWNFVARKSAHLVEYVVLFQALLLAGLRTIKRISPVAIALLCLFVCIGWAASDEVHQIFVPGRTPAILDVLLDSGGALTSFFGWLLWRRLNLTRLVFRRK